MQEVLYILSTRSRACFATTISIKTSTKTTDLANHSKAIKTRINNLRRVIRAKKGVEAVTLTALVLSLIGWKTVSLLWLVILVSVAANVQLAPSAGKHSTGAMRGKHAIPAKCRKTWKSTGDKRWEATGTPVTIISGFASRWTMN